MINGDASKTYKRVEESELTPAMLVEYRRLQHELQCQEALLVLMQKLKTNQRLVSQTNSNGLKQRATATKLNQQPAAVTDAKIPLTATKQPQQPLATVGIPLESDFLFESIASGMYRTMPIDPHRPNRRIPINIRPIVPTRTLN